jgi:uncharacterized protein (DUF983 family)
MHIAKRLVLFYLVISLLSLAALLIPQSGVNTETWVHATIIALTAGLLYLFTHKAHAADKNALLRIRIVISILIPALFVTAIILNIPLWLRVEHIIAMVVLVFVAVIVFRHHIDS